MGEMEACPFCGSEPKQNAWWEWQCSNIDCPIRAVAFRSAKQWNMRVLTKINLNNTDNEEEIECAIL